MNPEDPPKTEQSRDAHHSLPSLTVPKGGGAIKGIGEKFAANPVTGTGSLTIPLPLSPSRSGFTPALALSYDSGSGNGPFGFGWSIGSASITRRTDKGLPRYLDNEESDVFILSGAEDLVPVLNEDGSRFENEFEGYRITRYRPRSEGLFARIECWTNLTAPEDTFWRSLTSDNLTTFYGKTADSRIFDPADPTRIFSWLICQSYDDKGNAVVYQYQGENSDGVSESQVQEKNRTSAGRTANRYLKRVKYGNRKPNRHETTWEAIDPLDLPDETWMFELVFDYDEGHYFALPESPEFVRAGIDKTQNWTIRRDPFSTYRAGFEVRTYRLCRRVLMFHHFPEALQTPDCLVRSTEFTYDSSPIASFITEVTQSGYTRRQDGAYLKRSFPPLTFNYSKAVIRDEVETVDPASLENLPAGAGIAQYEWLDLDGEGLQGVLSELTDAWYYKRNESPIATTKINGKEIVVARLAPVTEVATLPSTAEATGRRNQFLDLAGDGNLDLVQFEQPASGFFERSDDESWKTFVPFNSLPNLAWNDPNLRFIDLTGDGHADVLITEDHALTWYPSLAEDGFGRAVRVPYTFDEEQGPAVVFADGTQAIVTADLSGDGLTDIVRIRNGETCYWPNLGYGRFGAKVTMENAPWFDAPDQFDQKRIRLADIDGSGTTDIIYFERDRVAIYRNECGNSWAAAEYLDSFPPVDDLSSVNVVDLLGIGTACLVWSSPLPGNAQRQMRYIDLMGRQKPHLLTHVSNNLGAETLVEYAPSTKFYLADKIEGKPWITRLPFPVHVVERVETRDLISRTRFVARYKYHHGYYDGFEREFRGFGMVEQFDTEEIGALNESPEFPNATNIDEASYVPPVKTKTWFHTGAFLEGERVSRQFEDEYYREDGLSVEQRQAMLLRDTELPSTIKQQDGSSIPWTLTTEEVREAHRALKGSVLRQEVYALDGTEEESRPYSVSEQNYTIELLQPEFANRHAVFFVHPREAIQFHYERKLFQVGQRRLADPRVVHQMTLEVDAFGNVVKSVAIGYGRRHEDTSALLTSEDREKQSRVHVTCTENAFTNSIDEPDTYRKPLASETRTYELIELPELKPAANQPDITNFFRFEEMAGKIAAAADGQHDVAYENFKAEGVQQNQTYRRLIEHVRTLYRRDDFTALLPLGHVQSLALAGESYKLAFTPGLLTSIYRRGTENLLADVPAVLGSTGADGGGYIRSDELKAENLFPAADLNDHWWIPSGRAFFDTAVDITNPALTAPQELTEARRHFFLPRKFVDPFAQDANVDYDDHDLLVTRTSDALNNVVQAESDYRVLQPRLITDANGNQTKVAFDALGMVAATAVMNRDNDKGDLLDDSFASDPTIAQLRDFVELPREASANPDESEPSQIARELLGSVTTRIVYDLDRFRNSGKPPFAATLARETHFRTTGAEQSKIQISFSYSDGFGREIQKKIQAEPGPVEDSGPDVNPRWVSSGWTIFNNKGKAVRQYEPFFTSTHDFEFANTTGVSPVLFYDPVGRVVATLHPNHTWEKVVFDPWQQTTYDVNDTVTIDPRTDEDVKDFFKRLPDDDYLPTWFELRTDPQFTDESERVAAQKAAKHADTPAIAYLDSLGRTFLTIADNKFERERADGSIETMEEKYATRVEQDIESNQREVIDARDRVVMRYDYDMLGHQIHQSSMEAGERWVLNDVAGKAIRAWDSRGHTFRTEYDALRRPKRSFVRGADPASPNEEICFGVSVYGEEATHAADLNLRGQVLLVCDSAGIVVNEQFDFKGNLLQTSRRVAREYKRSIDWSGVSWSVVEGALAANPFELEDLIEPFETLLEEEVFASSSTYDALNRPIRAIAPDNSVYTPTFNEANLLEKVDVDLRGEAETAFVTDIDYDAKGQRTLIRYGNDATTTYEYDKLTFRLKRLTTTRPADPDNFASQIFNDASTVQDLHYTYDPVGNITRIEDRALRTVFNGVAVEATCSYIYDATYRLIEAKGREHIGQTAHDFNPSNRRDFDFAGFAHPNDTHALRNYTEIYEYDHVGNFTHVRHKAVDGSWIRTYQYQHDSLINALQKSNRLTQTSVGSHPEETYKYIDQLGKDVHGCMTSINNMTMKWNFRDQLRQVDLGGGGTAFYVYDGGGQRTRKVIETQNGRRQKERIYVGGFEVYREFDTNDASVTLERETLHVMDDKQRIALVETKTTNNSAPLIRYQLGNHLGSASVELDQGAQVISYEEYHPYGTTAFQVGLMKQYRYTGMERDEETGFAYHTARYYLPWLARWSAPDPDSHLFPHWSHFVYSFANPVNFADIGGNAPKGMEDLIGDLNSLAKQAEQYERDYNRFFQELDDAPEPTPDRTKRINDYLNRGQQLGQQIQTQIGELEAIESAIDPKDRDVVTSARRRAQEIGGNVGDVRRRVGLKLQPQVIDLPHPIPKELQAGAKGLPEARIYSEKPKTLPPGGGGGGGAGKLAKAASITAALMPDPSDAVMYMGSVWVYGYGGAHDHLESTGRTNGFAVGLAAGLLQMSPEWVSTNLGYKSISPNYALLIQGIRERAFNAGLVEGYRHATKKLYAAEKAHLLTAPLAARGFVRNEKARATLDDVWLLGGALVPTVNQIFEKQREEELRKQRQEFRQMMRETGCTGRQC